MLKLNHLIFSFIYYSHQNRFVGMVTKIFHFLIYFLLFYNVLGLDFDNLADWSLNKSHYINALVCVLIIITIKLEDKTQNRS